ncbi:hypothetical protein [Nocardioides sp. 1609]|uniref:hypothetical protein n=1 Tax=Nocardioides sp. 1609 TaxID=2508327 RepID=UPI0010701336|nr:hypothetical protein [Nocardioides sp. 1609]
MLKTPFLSLSLLAAVAAATLTGLPSSAHAESAGAAAPKRVQVTNLTTSYEPTTLGTEVTVGYTLKNVTAFPRSAQFVRFYLLPQDGGKRALFGRAAVRRLPAGDSLSAKATRRVGQRFVEGDYRVRVCYSRRPQAVCTSTAVTPRAAVTIAPARLTADDARVVVPLLATSELPDERTGAGLRAPAPSDSVRVVLTNTGQARTGALRLAIETDESDFPTEARKRAAPPAGFEVVATTCKVSLAPGRSCTVDVRRTEGSNQLASGRLVLTGARGASTVVDLASPVFIDPSSHDFGEVAVSESVLHTFEAVNDSDQSIQILGGNLDFTNFTYDVFGTSPFTCAEMESAVGLAPGESCTVTVRYAPLTVGEHASSGYLYSSVGAIPFQVSGTGTPGEAPTEVRPGARSFGVTR